jgi:hypothetical protein
MDIITRADARAQGLKRFFTGKPCMHGHVQPRYVVSGSCMHCSSPTWRRAYAQTGGTMLRIFVRVPINLPQNQREALERYILDACVPAFLKSLP